MILTDHSHAPNPDALISIELKSKVSENAVISNDAPRKIIHEALLSVLEGEGHSGQKKGVRSNSQMLNQFRVNGMCTT